MENLELANTSTKVNKKKKSKYQEPFVTVDHNVKPRRSFWKNIFKKSSKKSEVPEMPPDKKSELTTNRLNSIFEETKVVEDKEKVVEEIEEIKKTLKKISNTSPPSVLLAGINTLGSCPRETAPKTPKEDLVIDYLSDVSSSDDEQDEEDDSPNEDEEKKIHSKNVLNEKFSTKNSDSLDDIIDKLKQVDNAAEAGKKTLEQTETPLGKDGYSFEYSETSDSSTEDQLEEKTMEKVTFDDKVETKDADSNIIVRELNPSENKLLVDDEKIKSATEMNEIEVSNVADETTDLSKTSIPPHLLTSKIPVAVTLTPEQQQLKAQQAKRSTTSTPNTENSGINRVTSRESFEEMEIRCEQLNELSVVKKPLNYVVDVKNRGGEFRLDKFFKVVINTDNIMTYSVAYDPLVEVYPFEKSTIVASAPNDEKQKVVRKRKMMSLLHDKTTMEECLRQIEQTQKHELEVLAENAKFNDESQQSSETQTIAPESIYTFVPVNSPTIVKENKFPLHFTETSSMLSEENTLFVLEKTKTKLQKFVDRNTSVDPKIHSLYPDNYLEIFNLNATQSNHDLQESSSNSDLSSIGSSNSQRNIKSKDSVHSIKDKTIKNNVNNLMAELLENSEELKETCILNTNQIDVEDTSEPLITMQPMVLSTVETILNEVLDRVIKETNHTDLSCTNFVKDINKNENEPSKMKTSAMLPQMQCNHEVFSMMPFDSIPREKIIQQAHALVESIENLVMPQVLQSTSSDQHRLEKSKKFGPYYDMKPGESQEVLELPKRKEIYKNFRASSELPEVTDSLQHIFFGDASNEAMTSEFNLVEPLPSERTSIYTDFSMIKPGTSTNLNISQLNYYEDDEEEDACCDLTTITENKLYGLNHSSLQTDLFPTVASSNTSTGKGSSHRDNLELERKSPDTDLHRFCVPYNKDDIDQSIEENLKSFQAEMSKVTKLNKKTVEMLNSSTFSTPEGSISILSTITENLLAQSQPTSQTSHASERYPQFIPSTDLKPADINNSNSSKCNFSQTELNK